ncbi:MAG: NADH-quinone oxidoreductase subunit C [Candidatus Omnitrophica bacterium]|nr:NADH-quinone oxidoreductase subunit C [Candidatus Omnitrophota bacterium]MDD5436462.1 NADH-quinone oxidoreductase subunit C [Candidatus Omnitrophota bacterium]
MTKEESIQSELVKKFGALEGKTRIQRPRRIFTEAPPGSFREIFEYAIQKLGFVVLSTITGLDEGTTLGFMYHIAREDGIMLNIKVSVDRNNPVIKTITEYFPAADIYERELMDLLGAQVQGLPKATRYPLSDDWPADEYPLRKDWKKSTGSEAKNNA